MRGKNDIWVVSFFGHIDISTNMHAEFEAIRLGLLIAKELGDMKIELGQTRLKL